MPCCWHWLPSVGETALLTCRTLLYRRGKAALEPMQQCWHSLQSLDV